MCESSQYNNQLSNFHAQGYNLDNYIKLYQMVYLYLTS